MNPQMYKLFIEIMKCKFYFGEKEVIMWDDFKKKWGDVLNEGEIINK